MPKKRLTRPQLHDQHDRLLADVSSLLEQARRTAARSVNTILTSVYWQIGRRIVEHEQGGKTKAEYGAGLLVSLARDLTARYGRGFSKSNLFQMRTFFLGWEIFQTASGKSEMAPTVPAPLANGPTRVTFSLSWSHYLTVLPDPETLRQEIVTTQRAIEARRRLE